MITRISEDTLIPGYITLSQIINIIYKQYNKNNWR